MSAHFTIFDRFAGSLIHSSILYVMVDTSAVHIDISFMKYFLKYIGHLIWSFYRAFKYLGQETPAGIPSVKYTHLGHL